jgi:hypothetical protein
MRYEMSAGEIARQCRKPGKVCPTGARQRLPGRAILPAAGHSVGLRNGLCSNYLESASAGEKDVIQQLLFALVHL